MSFVSDSYRPFGYIISCRFGHDCLDGLDDCSYYVSEEIIVYSGEFVVFGFHCVFKCFR